ncbi:flavodoxin [Streptomyces sp. NPDC059524]|uniref:flavodoxin n=1 Tax=Streptomyces sp. NPDC059524 TaxID=3346856 RepID=UPI003688C1B2
MHARLTRFARALPTAPAPRGRAFVFATSGLPELPWAPFTRPLARVLAAKGFGPAGTFSCRAYDTWAPFRLVGGINKRRPDGQDLAAVREFGARLRERG